MRAAGLRQPVLMFGRYLPEAMPALLEHGLTSTSLDHAGAEAASRAAAGVAAVYVKVDGGLGRRGVPMDAALKFKGRRGAAATQGHLYACPLCRQFERPIQRRVDAPS